MTNPIKPLTAAQLRQMKSGEKVYDSRLNLWCFIYENADGFKVIHYFGGGSRQIEDNRYFAEKPGREKV
jgi:hypothetical protein